MRSSMNGAAAARLGNDQTPGRWQSPDHPGKSPMLRPLPPGRCLRAGHRRPMRPSGQGSARPPPPSPCPVSACGPRWSGRRPSTNSRRVIGTVREQVDVGPVLGQVLRDVLVHPGHVVDPVQPSRDPRLVRHHRDGNTGPVEAGDRLRCALDEFDPVDRADVSMVDDDRAVAIEKDPRARTRNRGRTPRTGPVQTGPHSRHHVTSPNLITRGAFRPVSIGAASGGP